MSAKCDNTAEYEEEDEFEWKEDEVEPKAKISNEQESGEVKRKEEVQTKQQKKVRRKLKRLVKMKDIKKMKKPTKPKDDREGRANCNKIRKDESKMQKRNDEPKLKKGYEEPQVKKRKEDGEGTTKCDNDLKEDISNEEDDESKEGKDENNSVNDEHASSSSSSENDDYYDEDSLNGGGSSYQRAYFQCVRECEWMDQCVEDILDEMEVSDDPKEVVEHIHDLMEYSGEYEFKYESMCISDKFWDKALEMDWRIIEYFHDGKYNDLTFRKCVLLSNGEVYKYLEEGGLWSMDEINDAMLSMREWVKK